MAGTLRPDGGEAALPIAGTTGHGHPHLDQRAYLWDVCSGCSGGWSPQPHQALSPQALSSITCNEGQAMDATWSRCHWAPWSSLALASHEDEEQNHLSLISLEATKGIRAGGEQAPGEGAGITS